MHRDSRAVQDKRAATTLTSEDARVYLRRFPAQGKAQVAINLGMVLAGNGIVFWLLSSGSLREAHLIALVMAETILLIAIAWLLQRCVPKQDWLEKPKPWREIGPVLGFVMVWLGGAYGMTLLVVNGYPDVLALLRTPHIWIESKLYLAVLYTVLLALVHALVDLGHYRRNGGPFVSEVSHDAMARYLTLILGAIPFAMPFFAVTIGGFKGLEYVFGRARIDPARSVLAAAAMLVVAGAGFVVVKLLIDSGVHGWAIGFVFAKLIAEIMIVCIPLVMVRVLAEETANKTPAAAR